MSTAIGGTLRLAQEKGSGFEQLLLGDTPCGLMGTSHIADATGHSAEGSWLFDQKGLSTQLSIRVLPGNAQIASFAWDGIRPGRDGVLTFPDGRRHSLQRTPGSQGLFAASSGEWSFGDSAGNRFVSTRLTAPESIGDRLKNWSPSRTTAEITTDVHEMARPLRELPLLVLLATYLAYWTAAVYEAG